MQILNPAINLQPAFSIQTERGVKLHQTEYQPIGICFLLKLNHKNTGRWCTRPVRLSDRIIYVTLLFVLYTYMCCKLWVVTSLYLTFLQGSIFRSENVIYSPPLLKMIFFPLLWHVVFWLPLWPFCPNSSLFCNYFTLLLPLFSFSFPIFFSFPFFPFYFPFLPFSFPFLPFSFTFSPFSLRLFIFFPPNDISWYPPPRGGGYFPIYRPLHLCESDPQTET